MPMPDPDPIAMYIIVKESLNMSIGKTAAQCAHASQLLTEKFFDLVEIIGHNIDPSTKIFVKWQASNYRKVVLKADDKEFEKVKSELDNIVVITDAGFTELDPGTETVIGVWPMHKSQSPKCIKRLQVLK